MLHLSFLSEPKCNRFIILLPIIITVYLQIMCFVVIASKKEYRLHYKSLLKVKDELQI